MAEVGDGRQARGAARCDWTVAIAEDAVVVVVGGAVAGVFVVLRGRSSLRRVSSEADTGRARRPGRVRHDGG